jgi:diphthamide synthase (EF-2-diphthine--ammonia ligase)
LIRSGVPVAALVTTFDRATRRIPIHNVAIDQIVLQAATVRLPLWPVALPWPCPNDEYEQALRPVFEWAKSQGITRAAFGDLFLEDIRKFRERLLDGAGIEPLFPNWGVDTTELAHRMLAAGYRARVVAVDERVLSRDLVGREFDEQFLAALPPGVDPCGENGEFHTFVYAGAIFSAPLRRPAVM